MSEVSDRYTQNLTHNCGCTEYPNAVISTAAALCYDVCFVVGTCRINEIALFAHQSSVFLEEGKSNQGCVCKVQ